MRERRFDIGCQAALKSGVSEFPLSLPDEHVERLTISRHCRDRILAMPKNSRRRTRAARPTVAKHLELDRYTGVLDVAVIDVLSQAEFLLNRAREIQRHILRVRGVAGGSIAGRKAAAVVVQRIAREMRSESRQLAHVLKDLEYSANALTRAARAA